MARPEQHGDKERSCFHEGKHGGELRPDGQKHESGAFAKGNTIAKSDRNTIGKTLHKAFREQVGEERIRQLADQLMEIATSEHVEIKDRISAAKLIFDKAFPAESSTMTAGMEQTADGSTRIVFQVKGEDGEVQDA